MSDMMDRLQDLSELKQGWMDGYGEEISPKAIAKALVFINKAQKEGMFLCLFPTLEGGIQIEWDNIEYVIHPNGKCMGISCRAGPLEFV